MLPDGVLSTIAEFSPANVPVKSLAPQDLLQAWERGGVALQDPSQGLLVKLWTLNAVKSDDGSGTVNVSISAPGSAPSVLISGVGITEVDLAFDQNMKPAVAYVQNGQAKLWWYDTTIPGLTTIILPAGASTPRCTLDDHRLNETGKSDIILAYVNAGNLCYRQQRDRFQTEYVLKAVGAGAQLISVAMGLNWRLQFHVHDMTTPTDNQTKVISDPLLADIVRDLCKRSGIDDDALDVSELYNDTVPGYGLNQDSAVSEYMKPLAQVFTFDPTEFDRKLHFFKRGRAVSIGVSWSDLVSTNDDSEPMKPKLADKTKLPKTVNVTYTDPSGGYATNKQYAMRRSNQIDTEAKQDIDLNMTLTADQAAQLADITLKAQWNELITYDFQLPISFTALVPGDVFDYFAKDGSTQRIRVTTRNEADDIIKYEGQLDGGALVYGSSRVGLPLPYPTSTTPGLIGATRLEVLNIPALYDQDDELGIYVAVAGSSDAWFGAQVLFSTDGVNFAEAYRTETPATLGDTTTELLAEISAEYPSYQSVTVSSNFPLESVDADALFNNANRCVIGDEVLQFQTATYLGNSLYKLDGLVRARYNTKPEYWPSGTRFVLLDTAVQFIQAQRYMLGMEIWFKPVSFGVTDDESVPTTYEFTTAYSQQEWPPTQVETARDGSNNVTVSWIARPRLGIEIAPHDSKYFTGYKVRFSDGFTAQTTSTTYTRAAAPAGVTVSVCGENSITGDGEFSEEIAT